MEGILEATADPGTGTPGTDLISARTVLSADQVETAFPDVLAIEAAGLRGRVDRFTVDRIVTGRRYYVTYEVVVDVPDDVPVAGMTESTMPETEHCWIGPLNLHTLNYEGDECIWCGPHRLASKPGRWVSVGDGLTAWSTTSEASQ